MGSGWDKSNPKWFTWTPPPKSPSTSGASGSGKGVDTPSSSSTGSEPPLRPLSTPGETEKPLDPEGALKSVPTTGSQPTSLSRVKTISFKPETKVIFYDPNHPPNIRLDTAGTATGKQQASPGKTKSVSFKPETKVIFYDPNHPPNIRLDTAGTATGKQQASPGKTKSVSFAPTTKVHLLGPVLGDLTEVPKAQPNNVFSTFKSVFSKLGGLNFRPRFQRTVDTGA
jgi:hypothetical protein